MENQIKIQLNGELLEVSKEKYYELLAEFGDKIKILEKTDNLKFNLIDNDLELIFLNNDKVVIKDIVTLLNENINIEENGDKTYLFFIDSFGEEILIEDFAGLLAFLDSSSSGNEFILQNSNFVPLEDNEELDNDNLLSQRTRLDEDIERERTTFIERGNNDNPSTTIIIPEDTNRELFINGNISLNNIDEDSFLIVNKEDLISNIGNIENINNVSIEDILSTNSTITQEGDNYKITPNENYNGELDLTYTVSELGKDNIINNVNINVNPINDKPTIDINSVFTINEDFINNFNLNLNDIDGDEVSITSISSTNSTVSINEDNDIINYIPNENYFGLDNIIIQYTDGNSEVLTKNVEINIQSINDIPIVTGINDLGNINEDEFIIITTKQLIENVTDVENDEINVSNLSITNATIVEENGGYKIIPNENYNGELILTYQITDDNNIYQLNTAKIIVDSVNDEPTIEVVNSITLNEDSSYNLTYNFEDIDGDNVSITGLNSNNGTANLVNDEIVYVPNENYFGSDMITIEYSDGNGNTITKDISVTVESVNDLPIVTGINDLGIMDEDTSIIITKEQLIENVTDIENDEISISNLQSNNATITINNQGDYIITPNENYNGELFISYDVTDDGIFYTENFSKITVNDIEEPKIENDYEVNRIENIMKTISVQDTEEKEVTVEKTREVEVIDDDNLPENVVKQGDKYYLQEVTEGERVVYNQSFNEEIEDDNSKVINFDTNVDTVEITVRNLKGNHDESMKIKFYDDNNNLIDTIVQKGFNGNSTKTHEFNIGEDFSKIKISSYNDSEFDLKNVKAISNESIELTEITDLSILPTKTIIETYYETEIITVPKVNIIKTEETFEDINNLGNKTGDNYRNSKNLIADENNQTVDFGISHANKVVLLTFNTNVTGGWEDGTGSNNETRDFFSLNVNNEEKLNVSYDENDDNDNTWNDSYEIEVLLNDNGQADINFGVSSTSKTEVVDIKNIRFTLDEEEPVMIDIEVVDEEAMSETGGIKIGDSWFEVVSVDIDNDGFNNLLIEDSIDISNLSDNLSGKEIDVIELGVGNQILNGLNMEDLLIIEDEELIIKGDLGDKISLDTDEWSKGDKIEVDNESFDVYVNPNNNLKLFIDDEVEVGDI